MLEKKRVAKDVINIAWPVFVELMLGSLFGMVNMMMIGRIADPQYSSSAVAAIGLSNQPLFLAVSLVQALNVGSTAIISRYYGANKIHLIENVLKHVMILSVLCFIIPLAALGFVFAPNLLASLGGQAYTVEIGVPYFRLMMLAFVFQGIMLTISAALRGVGETKIPMRNNVIANIINVCLNSVLIYGSFGLPALGLIGTGIATVIANFVSATLMFGYLIRKKSKITFSFKDKFHFDTNTIVQLFKLGFPSAMEQLLFRAGAMLFTVIVSNLGTSVYAAHQIGLNLWTLSIAPSQAFGIAASTLTGKYLGSNQRDLAKMYSTIIRYMALLVSIVMAGVFYFFGQLIASGYSSSIDVIEQVVIVLPILALIQPFLAEQIVLAGSLRGAGDTIWPMIATIIGVFVVRTVLAHIFVNEMGMGIIGAWWALLANQLTSSIIVWIRYRSGKWQYVKI
ncbi:MATE family efflux transporter [Carnobacteriaceae bacterium zg-ZUI252]|nr:MATE family efflux transporter [Carnobacteriaceae bacterium zg-ZUI252]QTU83340.1 MATE family efflux transporter [Carnobacteriaceae bacterium zg-C25]